MKQTSKTRPRRNLSGARIRIVRLASQPPVTQVLLVRRMRARGIYIDQTTLSRIEKQERGVTDLELRAFARCLKTTIAWLCGERGAKR